MSEKGEYVIDHWYFFRHAEVCKKRYHAATLEEAEEKLKIVYRVSWMYIPTYSGRMRMNPNARRSYRI